MYDSTLRHRLPLWLGYSGLLPMSAFLAGLWFWPQLTDQLIFMAMLYVGTIFSFLGGIQWGFAVTSEARAASPEFYIDVSTGLSDPGIRSIKCAPVLV